MFEIFEVPEWSPAREDIYRLRYQIFCVEEQIPKTYADSVLGTIREPLDETGHVYAAYVNDRLVGTVRADYAAECDLDEYFDKYGLSPEDSGLWAMSSKFAIAREFRASTLAYRLIAVGLCAGLAAGLRFSFIACCPDRVPLYQRLGCKVHGTVRRTPPETGKAVIMVLDMNDETHLRQVRSPLLKHVLASKEGVLVS